MVEWSNELLLKVKSMNARVKFSVEMREESLYIIVPPSFFNEKWPHQVWKVDYLKLKIYWHMLVKAAFISLHWTHVVINFFLRFFTIHKIQPSGLNLRFAKLDGHLFNALKLIH